MTEYQLDDIDKQLLNLLQANAQYNAIELADEIGVFDNTIHNRTERLEEANIITEYTATTDYNRAGPSLYFHFRCTAPISERSTVPKEAIALPQIVEVTELMTGHENLHLKAVGGRDEDITALAERLDNPSLEINDENFIRAIHASPPPRLCEGLGLGRRRAVSERTVHGNRAIRPLYRVFVVIE